MEWAAIGSPRQCGIPNCTVVAAASVWMAYRSRVGRPGLRLLLTEVPQPCAISRTSPWKATTTTTIATWVSVPTAPQALVLPRRGGPPSLRWSISRQWKLAMRLQAVSVLSTRPFIQSARVPATTTTSTTSPAGITSPPTSRYGSVPLLDTI